MMLRSRVSVTGFCPRTGTPQLHKETIECVRVSPPPADCSADTHRLLHYLATGRRAGCAGMNRESLVRFVLPHHGRQVPLLLRITQMGQGPVLEVWEMVRHRNDTGIPLGALLKRLSRAVA